MATVMSMFILSLLWMSESKSVLRWYPGRCYSYSSIVKIKMSLLSYCVIYVDVPGEVFVHCVFIFHPRVSINKELQHGEKSHRTKCYQRHWGRDTTVTTVPHIFIIIHIIFTSEGCPTRPPRRWRLHVALGHFGEGVQLPHQAQSFPPGQTPHVRVQDAAPPPPRPPPTKHQSTSGLQAGSDLWPLTLWLLILRMQIFTLWGKQYFSFRRIHLIDKSIHSDLLSYPFITWS